MPDVTLGAPDMTVGRFTPPVVPEGFAGPVKFEATVTESPASVAFEYNGVDRPMYDNGTNGDLVAGDGTWTIEFTTQEILSRNTAGRVYRPIVGYCKPAGGGRFNIIGEVWTPAVGLVPIRQLDATTQETDYLINIQITRPQLLGFTNTTARTWAQRLYAFKQDRYDFINFVLVTGTRGNRNHFTVRNDVQGVGISIHNNSAQFGSAGRLKGCSVFPMPSMYDGGGQAYNHETGHQWICFLSGTPLGGTAHFAKGSAAVNVMGFSVTAGVGGNYTYTFTPNGSGGYLVGPDAPLVRARFNDLELYLAGLIPPTEVGPHFALVNQNQNIVAGQTLQANEVTPVTVNDIIAAKGARVPNSMNSQKTFRSATVVLSDTLLDPYSLSLYDWFTRRSEGREALAASDGLATMTSYPWYQATGGRSVMFSKMEDEIPAMRIERSQAGQVTLRFTGKLGIRYQAQGSTDLSTWTEIGEPVTPGDNQHDVVITPPAGVTHAFYRLQILY